MGAYAIARLGADGEVERSRILGRRSHRLSGRRLSYSRALGADRRGRRASARLDRWRARQRGSVVAVDGIARLAISQAAQHARDLGVRRGSRVRRRWPRRSRPALRSTTTARCGLCERVSASDARRRCRQPRPPRQAGAAPPLSRWQDRTWRRASGAPAQRTARVAGRSRPPSSASSRPNRSIHARDGRLPQIASLGVVDTPSGYSSA